MPPARRRSRTTVEPAPRPAADRATDSTDPAVDVAALLRVIGRGSRGSRDLDAAQSQALMRAMLRGELAELQLGAVLMALRLKGESADEMLGFARAVDETLPRLDVARPVVVLSSVNGARRLANQVPLLCLQLQRRGIASLVIGDEHADGRLHTAALWSELGMPGASGPREAEDLLGRGEPAYMDLRGLHPGLGRLTACRRLLGVRNVGHTLVKMLFPPGGRGLLLSGYTHGEYGPRMQQVLDARGVPALLLHGCEGEAVPHPSRRSELTWSHAPAGFDAPCELPGVDGGDLPQLGTDLGAQRDWTRDVLAGQAAMPAALAAFIDIVAAATAALPSQAAPPP